MELSILVSLEASASGAEAALASVSPSQQKNEDYEVIVIEPSIDALAAAVERSNAALIGILDGPCVVTPRVVEHALLAARLADQPLIVVPAYTGASAADDVYDRLDGASFSAQNPKGYLVRLVEARCFFARRDTVLQVLREQRGALQTCDDLFGALTKLPEARLIVLGGEGCIEPDLPRAVTADRDLRGRAGRQPRLFGVVPGQLTESLRVSIAHAAMHEALARKHGHLEWRLDPAGPLSSAATHDPAPLRLSIVVVVYRIPSQAENTIFSLSTRYQWNVTEDEYEIIVVENRSPEMLGEERARQFGNNVRYFARDEPGVSPAPALNFGVAHARGAMVGLMVDGARLVTPRVVEQALLAARVHPRPLVIVPGFHLGPGLQHLTSSEGYDNAEEERLLASIDWKRTGYGLFEISVPDEASKNGFLTPLLECTCLFCDKPSFDSIGGMDERFDLPGGGEVNHDLFDRLCRLQGTKYFVLWGEGSFHQFHGGVSTSSPEDREAKLETFRRQYDAIRGHRFATFEREPTLLGTCAGRGHEVLSAAVALGRLRFGMKRAAGEAEWPNEGTRR